MLWCLAAAGGATLAFFAYIGSFSRYWADDYCIAHRVEEAGLFGAQIFWWENWTGRYSSVFASNVVALAGRLAAMYLTAFLLALGLFLLSWTFVQLCKVFFGRAFVLPSILLAEFVLITYVSAAVNRVESIYWLAGTTNYTLPMLFSALLVGLIAWSVNAKSPTDARFVGVVAFAVALLGAGFAETYMAWQTCALTFAVGASLVFKPAGERTALTPVLTAALLGSLIGGGLVYIAPGNELREAQLQAPLPTAEVVAKSFAKAAEISKSFLMKPDVILLGLVTLLLTPIAVAFSSNHNSSGPAARHLGLSAALVSVMALALVVASLTPAYRLLGTAPPDRAWVIAEVTVIAAVMFWGFKLGLLLNESLLPREVDPAARRTTLFATAVVLLIVGSGLVVVAVAGQVEGHNAMARHARAWDDRDAAIRSAQQSGVRNLRVDLLRPPARLLDVTTNETAWSNVCIASYYGLDSIRSPR